MNAQTATRPQDRNPRPRRPLWRRVLKWSLLGLLLLLLVLVGVTGWVAGTRSGLDFAWSLVAPRLPDTVEVAAVEGRLIGPLTVTGVKVDNASMHVAVDRVHLQWQVADLLSGVVHVQKLAVQGVNYVPKANAPPPPAKESTEPFSLPEQIKLPVQVQIDRVAVDDVSVTPAVDAEPVVLTRARLTDARLAADRWRIASLTANGPLFDISTQADVTPRDRYAARLTLDAALDLPDLAPIDAQLAIDGDLDALTVTARVAAPYDVALDAQISDIALDDLAAIGIDAKLALKNTDLTQIRSDLPAVAPITTTLTAQGTARELHVEQSVAAPYNLQLAAALRTVLDTPHIDARLTLDDTRLTAIRADLPDIAPISTQLTLKGTTDRLQLQHRMAAPYNMQLTAILTHVLDNPGIDAQLALQGTKLAAIRSDLPQVTLDTRVDVSGGPAHLTVAVDANADSADYGPVAASGQIDYTPQVVHIEQLQITRPDSPMQLVADGRVALAEGHAMDMQLQWQQLRWPLQGDAAYRSKQGQMQLTGALDDYQLAGQLGWQVAGQTAGTLQLTGNGDMQSFNLEQLAIGGGPGDISATAQVAWAPALKAQAHIRGEHINPGAVVADMPGDFSLQADLRAEQDGAVLAAHVDKLSANGRLRDQPLQLDAKLAYLGDHVRIDQFALDYGAATATASGQAGWTAQSALDLRWAIDARDLSTLWPTLAGTLKTAGTAQGTVSAPSLDADLTGRDIKYADYHVASADLDADVDWSGATPSDVELAIADVQAAGQTIHSLTLNLQGTPNKHDLNVKLDSDAAQLTLALEGALNKRNMNWDFTLDSLRAAYGELAAWTLAAPAQGQVSAAAQRIADACLTSGDARLCLSGEHTGQGSQAQVRLNDLALAYAKPLLPENLSVAGALSAAVDARLPSRGTPTIKARIKSTEGRITAHQADGKQVQVLAFDPAHVEVDMADSGLDATLALPLADTGNISAKVAVAAGDGALTERPLSGNVSIDVAQLDFVTRLVAEVAQIDGHIGGNMRIGGTLAAPNVLGDIALDASNIVLLTPGLQLTDVHFGAAGKGESVALEMAAESGGGTLSVDGGIDFDGAGPKINLAVKGDEFQVANMPIARAWISPDMNVSVTPEAIQVSGRLDVPKARITPRDLPAAGVDTVAADTVIDTGESSPAQAASRAIDANIEVVLGDVRIKGFGLETGIEGDLRVKQAPGEPATGAGKLTLVDGSYRAYGQNLDIQHGTIYFSGGPVTSPGLELRAARYPAEDITVGVEVRGNVKTPKVTLFSEPGMSQTEILSWLLLGRPLEGATGGENNLVAKAALALGSGRANKVLDNVGNALGLDDIGVGSAAGHGASEAAFMVGKYLTPKLYLSYGVGIFSSVSTLSLRYTLNSSWKLESSTSGIATGADIIYTFDR